MDLQYLIYGLVPAVLLAAYLVLKAIAPKTKTDADDKAASVLSKILDFLGKKPPQE